MGWSWWSHSIENEVIIEIVKVVTPSIGMFQTQNGHPFNKKNK